jgi:hypothetical protein
VPVMLSWQMTAMPIAVMSSSRQLRLLAGGDPLPVRVEIRPDQEMRMCDPSRSYVTSRQSVLRPRGHAGVTVSRGETLSDGI